MQSFSKVSAAQTSCGAYGQFRRRWLHGSLRQASIRTPAMTDGVINYRKQKEGDAFTIEVLLELESDTLEPVQINHLNSPSFSVTTPSPSTPMSTNVFLPLGPFVSPLFSPLTPTMYITPRTPNSRCEKHSTGYLFKDVQPAKLSSRLRPGLLELDFSSYPISPRFPPTASIPSPFRMQLQEDVATTPLPSGTPLTARWPGSGFQGSASSDKKLI